MSKFNNFIWLCGLCVALALFIPTAVQAQGVCFGRFYDAAHMRSHPNQQVEEIFFGTLTGRPILQVRLRHSSNYIYGYATCREQHGFVACDVENQQGNFTVKGPGDGTVMLRVGAGDVQLERGGDQEIVYLQHDAGDDRVFKLYQGKGCIN